MAAKHLVCVLLLVLIDHSGKLTAYASPVLPCIASILAEVDTVETGGLLRLKLKHGSHVKSAHAVGGRFLALAMSLTMLLPSPSPDHPLPL